MIEGRLQRAKTIHCEIASFDSQMRLFAWKLLAKPVTQRVWRGAIRTIEILQRAPVAEICFRGLPRLAPARQVHPKWRFCRAPSSGRQRQTKRAALVGSPLRVVSLGPGPGPG